MGKKTRKLTMLSAKMDDITREEIEAVLNGYTVISFHPAGKKPITAFFKP
jgi:NADH:ubiquinone oxidoreductase subunit E